MAKQIKLAGRQKAQNLEWIKWARRRPEPEDSLWLVDWRSLKSERCCVYVIAPDGQWPVKVGISHAPRSRLLSLQVGNWKRLEVAACYWTHSVADALLLEREVHRDYSQQEKWLLGEWIDARPNEAAEKIQWAAMILSIDISDAVPADAMDSISQRIDALWPWPAYSKAVGARYDITMEDTIPHDY